MVPVFVLKAKTLKIDLLCGNDIGTSPSPVFTHGQTPVTSKNVQPGVLPSSPAVFDRCTILLLCQKDTCNSVKFNFILSRHAML